MHISTLGFKVKRNGTTVRIPELKLTLTKCWQISCYGSVLLSGDDI